MPESNQSESRHFIPRSRDFWLCNTAGWGILLLFFLTTTVAMTFRQQGTEGSVSPAANLATVIFVVFLMHVYGTACGLLFRYWVLRREKAGSGFIDNLGPVFVTAALSALVCSTFVLVAAYLALGVPSVYRTDNGEVRLFDYLYAMMAGNGAGAFVIMALWCTLYLGIKSKRNIHAMHLRALELENHLKEARLNLLAGQLNPHFLFNALNNIRFMLHEDSDRADDSLVSLSGILRHSLESSRHEKVELGQELDIVEQYLQLMKNQMESRLIYSVTADTALRDFLVPPMIIQMLAENAIKHGIEESRLGGDIRITCAQAAGRLQVCVTNSLPDSRAESPDACSSGTGVGLENISKRLSLLYGAAAGLAVSTQGRRVSVSIELPVETVQ